MNLEKLRVKTRLKILIALGLVGLIALSGAALHTLRQVLIEDRREKVVEIVESAYSAIEWLHKESQAGRMSGEEAQRLAKTFLRAARYDSGRNYVFIIDGNIDYVVFPPNSEDEGVDVAKVQGNATRVGIMRNIVDAARSSALGGFYNYAWPKPPDTTPIAKITYARYFEPWEWAVITGIYIDDVDTVFGEELFVLGGIAAAIVAALLFGAMLVNRSIMRQLGGEISQVVDEARIIASGDLSSDIQVAADGENSLASTINTMQHKLRDIVGQIDAVVRVLMESVGHVSGATGEIGAATEKQASVSSTAAAEIADIRVSINEVSGMAAQSEQSAVVGNRISAEGVRIAADAGDVIGGISATVDNSSRQIELLVQKSLEIGGIAQVIRDVADQTNLLALNAAIEAARAGEQGRGFAVVADEVRKLAERTTQATSEINTMIAAIQKETQSAVASMTATKPQVEKGLALALKIRDMLEGIHREASASLESSRRIASSTQEQAMAVNKVAGSVEQIASSAVRTNTTIKNNAASIQELGCVTDKLRKLLSFFKT
jgi:methyl-accepting chemotaxis protein